ncbi:MAG: hypothetical protein ACXACR_12455, partial [Candidatus Hodarchaeales archaeon]
MLRNLSTLIRRIRHLKYSVIPLLAIFMFFPNIKDSASLEWEIRFEESQEQDHDFFPEVNNLKRASITVTTGDQAEENPDVFFPDFLKFSTSVANVLINNLYDNKFGGFFRSVNEYWLNTSIDKLKYTYDQAQAILALLKLSDAVINESDREFALLFAEDTGKYMISNQYDEENGGFIIATHNDDKKPGIQAQAIQALFALYDYTSNETYRDKAYDALNFINTYGWDDFNNDGYFYHLSANGDVAAPNPSSGDL